MADPVVCNVCRQEITDPVEAAKLRRYKVKATGHDLPPQRKHDTCDAAYAAQKTGLEKLA
jgi:hypothetical protein